MSSPVLKHDAVSLATPPVRWWEGLGIATGAILLVLTAIAGLADKAIRNATNPQRAEAIAQNLMSYQIPGGSKGVFGINIGSVKMAVVTNKSLPPTAPPTIELLTARVPITTTTTEVEETPTIPPETFDLISFGNFSVSYDLEGQFQVQSTQTENKWFCGKSVAVTVRRGTLTPDTGGMALPAIRYEAIAQLDDQEHQIILTTVGSDAKTVADQVFASLQCR